MTELLKLPNPFINDLVKNQTHIMLEFMEIPTLLI